VVSVVAPHVALEIPRSRTERPTDAPTVPCRIRTDMTTQYFIRRILMSTSVRGSFYAEPAGPRFCEAQIGGCMQGHLLPFCSPLPLPEFWCVFYASQCSSLVCRFYVKRCTFERINKRHFFPVTAGPDDGFVGP